MVQETPLCITVAEQDFDAALLTRELLGGQGDAGALTTFIGLVRSGDVAFAAGDSAGTAPLRAMQLEHYPGMTEKSLRKIAVQAIERWGLLGVSIYHRVGRLVVGDQIVFVGVAGRHRREAFDACAFIMDYLKTEAPFWKKELSAPVGLGEQGHWVDAKESDQQARERWNEKAP
ncbi:Molybdenum cofactor biosynthesis protein E [gamma proteobacterium HdN1]|nr:Molybdenum cofactor biosynthesis protein E [gamma proteobacterium HdN1]